MGALIRSGRADAGRDEGQAAQARQYLTFAVGAESFGMEISSIKEIIEFRKPTDVPLMPPFMRGVINLRGRVVPVIDLSVRFGRAALEAARRTCIVIVVVGGGDAHDLGVMVDAVSAVLEIAESDIEPAPSFGANLRADFIRALGKVDGRFVIILDVEKVLSLEELAALGAAAGVADAPARL
jgi:purine-binding chemotaxis protein CheW